MVLMAALKVTVEQKKKAIQIFLFSIKDMISYVTFATKKIRLVVIDYAGLSTNPEDIRLFLKVAKKVKEISIDHGHTIETLSRYDMLHGHEIINKFRCRKAPVRRSS